MSTKAKLNEILKNPKKYAESVEIKELEKNLRYFSDKYYNTGKPVVSDEIFDLMKDILQKRDPKNSFLSEVGAPTSREKIKLPYPMGSLDKIKPDSGELAKWVKIYKGPYVISDKLDGASAQFYRESEDVYKLYSRGNGIDGQDISHLIKYVMPSKIKIPIGTSIRGELIISKEDFKKIADKMKNARNAVSGLVNSKKKMDSNIAKITRFVAYTILYPRYTQVEQMKLLEKYGFDVVDHKIEKKLTNDSLSEHLAVRRKKSIFEVDGIVVIDSSTVYEHIAGNPEYGFAFKTISTEQLAETTVLDVLWETSMDGYMKPTISVEPINVEGVTIVSATAHNAKFIVDNKLGPGAVVEIVRSGGVIPYINKVIKPAKEPKMPDVPYKWSSSNVDIILKDIHGAQKDVMITKQLVHFFKTIGAKYLDEGMVTKFVNNGYNSVEKILSANKNKLTEIEGMGEKIITKIFTSVEAALKNTNLQTFMAASHILGRGLSSKKIKLILDKYPNIMEEKWSAKTMSEKLNEVKGFSDITTKKFVEGFDNFKKFFDKINKIIDISYLRTPQQKSGNLFEGKTVVFTGFRDKTLEEFITNNGGKVSSGVSGKTDLVVYAESVSDSSKLKKAKELNIKLMTQEDFINKYINQH